MAFVKNPNDNVRKWGAMDMLIKDCAHDNTNIQAKDIPGWYPNHQSPSDQRATFGSEFVAL
jgi:hypothetical protein